MSDLSVELRAAVAAHAPYETTVSAATIRALATNAGGNSALARRLGVTPRTVQRWQKEGGQTRDATKSTPALRALLAEQITNQRVRDGARALRGRAVTVEPTATVMVQVYEDERPRPRRPGAQTIRADAMDPVLDRLIGGDTAGAAEAFTSAYLGAYGMGAADDAVITDVRGTLRLL